MLIVMTTEAVKTSHIYCILFPSDLCKNKARVARSSKQKENEKFHFKVSLTYNRPQLARHKG